MIGYTEILKCTGTHATLYYQARDLALHALVIFQATLSSNAQSITTHCHAQAIATMVQLNLTLT